MGNSIHPERNLHSRNGEQTKCSTNVSCRLAVFGVNGLKTVLLPTHTVGEEGADGVRFRPCEGRIRTRCLTLFCVFIKSVQVC